MVTDCLGLVTPSAAPRHEAPPERPLTPAFTTPSVAESRSECAAGQPFRTESRFRAPVDSYSEPNGGFGHPRERYSEPNGGFGGAGTAIRIRIAVWVGGVSGWGPGAGGDEAWGCRLLLDVAAGGVSPRGAPPALDSSTEWPGCIFSASSILATSEGLLHELDGDQPVLPGAVFPSSTWVITGSSPTTSACQRCGSSRLESAVNPDWGRPVSISTQMTSGINGSRGTSASSSRHCVRAHTTSH